MDKFTGVWQELKDYILEWERVVSEDKYATLPEKEVRVQADCKSQEAMLDGFWRYLHDPADRLNEDKLGDYCRLMIKIPRRDNAPQFKELLGYFYIALHNKYTQAEDKKQKDGVCHIIRELYLAHWKENLIKTLRSYLGFRVSQDENAECLQDVEHLLDYNKLDKSIWNSIEKWNPEGGATLETYIDRGCEGRISEFRNKLIGCTNVSAGLRKRRGNFYFPDTLDTVGIKKDKDEIEKGVQSVAFIPDTEQLDPAEQVSEQETLAAMKTFARNHLHLLSPREREVWTAYCSMDGEGSNYGEVLGEKLRMSPSHARLCMSQAIRKLTKARAEYEVNGDEPFTAKAKRSKPSGPPAAGKA